MKNLILPTENQVRIDLQIYVNKYGFINMDNFAHYLKYVKVVIESEFSVQKIDFNSEDFFKMYHLYTLSPVYFSFLKL